MRLTASEPGAPVWEEGLTHLAVLYDTLQTASDICPPDLPGLDILMNLRVLVNILRHGPALSPDLQELQVCGRSP